MKKMTPKRRFTEKKIGGVTKLDPPIPDGYQGTGTPPSSDPRPKPYMKIGNTETPLNGEKLELFLENGTLTFDFSTPTEQKTGRRVVLKPVDGPTRVAADKYNGPPTTNPLKNGVGTSP